MSTAVYRSAEGVVDAMNRVYLNMFLSVLTSFAVSAYVAGNPELFKFFFTGAMLWVSMLAPLAFIFIVPWAMNSGISRLGAQGLLHAFAAFMGLSLSGVFAFYTLGSITSAFMAAAVLFGVMSLYGYLTKNDMSGWGPYFLVGLIALLIVMVINIFLGSSMLAMLISAVAIPLFMALTAYDTQRIREMVSVDGAGNAEIMGALTLYLDFINLFVHLLQFIGIKKD